MLEVDLAKEREIIETREKRKPKEKRPHVVVYEEEGGATIIDFKTDPKGKSKKFIKAKDWHGDPKELRRQAEKLKE